MLLNGHIRKLVFLAMSCQVPHHRAMVAFPRTETHHKLRGLSYSRRIVLRLDARRAPCQGSRGMAYSLCLPPPIISLSTKISASKITQHLRDAVADHKVFEVSGDTSSSSSLFTSFSPSCKPSLYRHLVAVCREETTSCLYI